MSFWQRWLIGAAISFIVRQLAKFGDQTDWDMIKKDLEPRVRALMPGDFFDDEAVQIMEMLVDRAEAVLKNSADIGDILELLKDGKWMEAWNNLRDLLLDGWAPVTAEEEKCRKLVKAAR